MKESLKWRDENFLKELKIEYIRGTSYQHQSLRVVERLNKTIEVLFFIIKRFDFNEFNLKLIIIFVWTITVGCIVHQNLNNKRSYKKMRLWVYIKLL